MTSILVIEDNQEVCENLLELLKEEGFTAAGAPNANTGIRLAGESKPDLILCDILLPDRTGYDVLSWLRKDPLTSSIPVVFLSALSDRDDIRRGMDLGADDYISKPFRRKDVLNAIQARLKHRLMLSSQAHQGLETTVRILDGSLSHELLPPVLGILEAVEKLRKDETLATRMDVISHLDEIHTSASRLHRTLHSFIFINQLDAILSDPAALAQKRSSPGLAAFPCISEVAFARAELSGRSQDLLLDIGDGTLSLMEADLHVLVDELLDNAFRYSPPGTQVVLAASSEESSPFYHLTIKNTGAPIPDDQLALVMNDYISDVSLHLLFRPGYGLLIARRLLEVYGGWLRCSNNPDGTVQIEAGLPIGDEEVHDV